MLNEFKIFIARGNVMDMAVGIIMGAAFTAIVSSMVGDIIMPVIGIITNGVDFADRFFALDGNTYASLAAAKSAGAPVITYGAFINAIINFVIVAFVIFLLVKGVNNLKKKAEDPKAKDAPPPPKDVLLLTEIRDLLSKEAQKPAPKAASVTKAPTKKAPTTKKPAAKKAAPKKTTVKKTAPKKTTAKKPIAKKATAKKTAPKKSATAPKK